MTALTHPKCPPGCGRCLMEECPPVVWLGRRVFIVRAFQTCRNGNGPVPRSGSAGDHLRGRGTSGAGIDGEHDLVSMTLTWPSVIRGERHDQRSPEGRGAAAFRPDGRRLRDAAGDPVVRAGRSTVSTPECSSMPVRASGSMS